MRGGVGFPACITGYTTRGVCPPPVGRGVYPTPLDPSGCRHPGCRPPWLQTPRMQIPPGIRSRSWRYASYWNAYLFQIGFVVIEVKEKDNMMVVVESCLHSNYRGKKIYSKFHITVVKMILKEFPYLDSWFATSSDWDNYKKRFGPRSVFQLWSKWVCIFYTFMINNIAQ